MEVNYKKALVISALALAGLSEKSQAGENVNLVRCDASYSIQDFRACLTQTASSAYPGTAPNGLYCGLNPANEAGACAYLMYEPELRKYVSAGRSMPDEVISILTQLSLAWRLDPEGFSVAKTYLVDVSVLPGGPHDPVRVSVGGSQSSDRGRMDRAVSDCLSNFQCVERINPALANRMAATRRSTGFGGQIGPIGGSYSWNFFPAELGGPAELWFCSGGNCANYRLEGNVWTFRMTRALNGNGAGYPNPDNGNSISWTDPGDSRDIWLGMRNAGYPVPLMVAGGRMVCGYINGQLDSCMYISPP